MYSSSWLQNFHSVLSLKMQPLPERNPGADQQHTTLLQHSSQQEINTLDIILKKIHQLTEETLCPHL